MSHLTQVMSEDAGYQEKGTKKKRRVENELMTKIEQIPCNPQYFCNTIRQEGMRGRLMTECTQSNKEDVDFSARTVS